MKRLSMALCVALLLFGVQVASAQRPGGGRGGAGFGGGPAALLTNEAVQKELNIADAQREKLREVVREMREGGGQRGDFQNLTQEERQKRIAEIQERAKKMEEKVNAILDEKQKERLEQLRIQRDGAAALLRADVAEKVGLAADQKEKIQKIQQDLRGGGQNFRDLSNEDRQKAFAEMRERREKAAAEILGVLTADQKEKFEKLKGAKFDFPQEGRGRQRNNNN